MNISLEILSTDSAVTRNIKRAFNTLTDDEFLSRYNCTKQTYYRRVKRYSDPYMNSPLAKFGKWLLNRRK